MKNTFASIVDTKKLDSITDYSLADGTHDLRPVDKRIMTGFWIGFAVGTLIGIKKANHPFSKEGDPIALLGYMIAGGIIGALTGGLIVKVSKSNNATSKGTSDISRENQEGNVTTSNENVSINE